MSEPLEAAGDDGPREMITPFPREGEQNPAYDLLSPHYQSKSQRVTPLHQMWWFQTLSAFRKVQTVNQLVKLQNIIFRDFGSVI